MIIGALNLIDKNNIPHPDANSLGTGLTVAYVIIGGVALLMFVIGGFRYILSAGDANKTAEAKRMIIYTAIGLIVTALAASIVGLVTGRLGT